MHQAGFLAERLETDTEKNAPAQIRRAFQLCFQREPEKFELAAAEKLVRAEGLAMFCRALFNANEFIYVF